MDINDLVNDTAVSIYIYVLYRLCIYIYSYIEIYDIIHNVLIDIDLPPWRR